MLNNISKQTSLSCSFVRSFQSFDCFRSPYTELLTHSLNSSSFTTTYSNEMSDKKQTVDLGLLEEDDEFEEFPAEGRKYIFK